jgi:YceI-like domain
VKLSKTQMIFEKIVIFLLGTTTAVALVSRSAPTRKSQPDTATIAPSEDRADLEVAYTAIGRAGGSVFTLSPRDSEVRIYVFRAGRAGRLRHNHVLSAPQFTGFFYLPASGAANGRFDLEFGFDQLKIDDPLLRSALSTAFSVTPSAADIQGTREHMLGADALQADRIPFVRIRSVQIAGEAPKFAAKIQIEMHGQKQEMLVPLDVQGLPTRLSVSGTFVLRQTDFGLRPYSFLGGLLTVQDEVVLDFKLTGDPLERK